MICDCYAYNIVPFDASYFSQYITASTAVMQDYCSLVIEYVLLLPSTYPIVAILLLVALLSLPIMKSFYRHVPIEDRKAGK